MSEKVTVDDIDSTAYRVLELLLFVPLLLIAFLGISVFGVGAVGPRSPDVTALVLGGGILLGYAILLLSTLAIPIVLYLDAKQVRAADAGWDPSPALYAVLGLLFSYLTALHYVWQRHNYVVDRVDSEAWVKLVVVGALAPPLSIAASSLLNSANATSTVIMIPIALIAVFAGLFPIALYKDATFVRLRSGGWQPNPGTYITIGMFIWLFAVFTYPITGAYYLVRRYRAIGF